MVWPKMVIGGKMINLTKENFDKEVLNNNGPVIVDFWAEWCGPCKMMGPIFEELDGLYGDKLKFTKLNTEEQSALSSKFGISGIPSLLVFNKGEVVDRLVGFSPKDVLQQKIDAVLEKL